LPKTNGTTTHREGKKTQEQVAHIDPGKKKEEKKLVIVASFQTSPP
jgi:hypothetical protein